jgi:hypothetical protein
VILASLVVFAVAFAAIAFAAVRIFQTSVSRLVVARHRDLEEIMDAEDVPRAWREPYEQKLAQLDENAVGSAQVAALTAKATRSYLTKLTRLRRYVETTRLVDGEETRQVLLGRLADLRDRVQQSPRV